MHLTLLSLLLLASPVYPSPHQTVARKFINIGRRPIDHEIIKRQDQTDQANTTLTDTPAVDGTTTTEKKLAQTTNSTTPSIKLTAGKVAATAAEAAAPVTDFALLVCGADNDAGTVASDSRDAATWTGHNMDDWFKKALDPYISSGWKAPDGTQKKNIQSIILTLMGADGSPQCDEISNPACSGQGLNWEKCKAHPEAHFLWFANTNWANFLNKFHETLQTSDLSLDNPKLTKYFYTPQANPQQLLVPLAIVAGIAGALSVAIPPLGVAAGGLSIAQGFIIQAGLDRADPLKQWSDVTSSVATTFTLLATAFEKIFIASLSTLPPASQDYYKNATMEPALFTNGRFASIPAVGEINNNIYSALASGAINNLWASDSVFLMIIDDKTWGAGKGIKNYGTGKDIGKACDDLPDYTTCVDGVAYLLMRWKSTTQSVPVTPKAGFPPKQLDGSQVFVWGAGPAGGPIGGEKNANHLPDYGLNLQDTVLSIETTWKVAGNTFPFTGQNKAVTDYLAAHPSDAQLKDFLFFSLPVCDLRTLFKDNQRIDHDTNKLGASPLLYYGACLCLQIQGWPTDKYAFGGTLSKDLCNKQAFKNI